MVFWELHYFNFNTDLQKRELNHRHQDIVAPNGKTKMELDVYYPSLSLAFEYNGAQHYHNTVFFGACKKQMARDKHKSVQCRKKKITLVIVPHWWDRQLSSLQATIYSVRPDVVADPGIDGTVIPAHPTTPFKEPSRGEGMLSMITHKRL